MFTGIVEELGTLVSRTDAQASCVLHLAAPTVAGDAVHGASIAVNGVCLTVTDIRPGGFSADVMAETLAVTTLGELVPGSPVNLERALPAAGRLGGHIVQGHVDGTTHVVSRQRGDRWDVVRFALPRDLSRYVVRKGSIALDGVSLTVSSVGEDWFEVSLIPTTLALTTLGTRRPGDGVNVEVDVLAKYVERLLGGGPADDAAPDEPAGHDGSAAVGAAGR